MYFFDLQGLIQHHRTHSPNAYDSFRYLAAYVWAAAIPSIIQAFRSRPAVEQPTWDLVLWSLGITLLVNFVVVAVLKGFYQSNGGSSGQYFLDRLLSLSWVIWLRVTVILLPIGAIAILGAQSRYVVPALALVLIAFGASIIYYIKTMNSALAAISKSKLDAIFSPDGQL